MDQIEYTMNDVAQLLKVRPDFALALENVVLKRMVDELTIQNEIQEKPKVTAIGKYKNG